MTAPNHITADDELIDQLAELGNARARLSLLRKHRQLWTPDVVERLYTRVVRLARTDLARADRLAQSAKWIADKLADEGCRAQSLRAIGHVHHTSGKYAQALQYYADAREIFRALGREVDVARTLNGALQSLMLLGRYDEALLSAADARAIFEREGNLLGLARLDSNSGNILYRQDRFEEALTLYRRAYEQLTRVGEPQDLAAALSNIAVVHISLNQFDEAVKAYHEARMLCERHNMPLLTVRADYNIADLYYLRGEYTRALDLYRAAREESDRLGDVYHTALCDLDRSGIYLELNLSDEAAELAEQARSRFEQLGMSYEAAKAVTNLALTSSRRGEDRDSHRLFAHARHLFAREGNQVWLALLDFYEALVLFRSAHYDRAKRLCEAAREQFARASISGKAAQCELLLARLALHAGDLAEAEHACRAAFGKLAGAEAPMVLYQAHCVLGLVREAQGDQRAAFTAFEQADHSLELLRNQLQSESLRVAFLEDKLDVYERLVTTCLSFGRERGHQETAFGYIEKAKSRSLADLIAHRAVTLTPRVASAAGDEVRRLRQELTWQYRQVEQEEVRPDARSARRVEKYRARAHAVENQLARAFDELRRTDAEFSVLQSGATFHVDEIRASLGSDTTILEYYQAMGQLYVVLLCHDRLDVVPLGAAAEVRSRVQLLQFQLGKFRLRAEHVAAFAAQSLAATHAHLRDLYATLIAPIRDRLRGAHLVIVPHGVLHSLPFHAISDGGRCLIDDFTVSYAPSASIYRLCCTKPAASTRGALVMGVPDALTPQIAEEVRAVAAILPESTMFLGADSTSEQLRRHGVASRFVHLATHGSFRKDNAMFSSILLGDGPLSVYDLYQLRLSAELVTLSGCGTGLAVTVAGDEQLGLVRGLLYAGARAVLLTLWDAHDRSTAEFMRIFYERLQQGRSKARAVQEGMQLLREQHPHPFYWAPFTLVGDADVCNPAG